MLSTDPTLFAFVEEFVKPGATVWDIGANLGLLTFAAAHRAGPTGNVLAVEPDIDNISIMLRSNRLMDLKTNARVRILPAAVGTQKSHVAEFQIASRARSANALVGFGGSQTGKFVETRCVPLFSLDELLESFPVPHVLKIDVEGAELNALQGGNRLMSEIRPIITVEVEREEQHVLQMAALFKQYHYKMYDADVPVAGRKETSLPAWNCLALPD